MKEISDPSNGDSRKQARYIIETGKLIHDRVTHVFSEHAAGSRKKKELYELSVPQFHAVKTLRSHGEATITELAKLLDVSAPSASAMVDRLTERGILTRERSREDRRKVVVRIAPEVAEDIAKIEGKILGSFIELVDRLGPETTRKWCEVLAHVQTVMTEQQEHHK